MAKVNIAGIGAWSERFSNWPELQRGLTTGAWSADHKLQPAVPLLVKEES